MFSGVRQTFSDNKKRLAAIAMAAVVLFLGAYFVDRLLVAAKAPEDTGLDLSATEVPRTPITESDSGRAITKILEDETYQDKLPETPESQQQNQKNTKPWPSWRIGVIKVVLAILGIFTVVVFIWILFVGSRGGALAQKPRKAMKRSGQSRAQVEYHMVIPEATLKDVERAAQEGRYGEAVRMLLSIALTTLAGRDLIRILPSMTGREIAASARIGADGVAGLTHLVLTVEAHAFAGEGVNKTLFEECLAAFQSLASLKAKS